METGSFIGVDVKYAGNVLTYTHRYINKNFDYKDNVPAMIKVDGVAVKYFWDPTDPKTERVLEKFDVKTASNPDECICSTWPRHSESASSHGRSASGSATCSSLLMAKCCSLTSRLQGLSNFGSSRTRCRCRESRPNSRPTSNQRADQNEQLLRLPAALAELLDTQCETIERLLRQGRLDTTIAKLVPSLMERLTAKQG